MTRLRIAAGTGILILASALAFAQPPIATIAGYGRGGSPDSSRYSVGGFCGPAIDGVQAKTMCLSVDRIAVGGDGTLYFTQYSTVFKVDAAGIVTTVVGGFLTNCRIACFEFISDLIVDRDGNVFIADYWNSRISRLTPGGDLSVVAGNGTRGFCGDGGPAPSACLHGPAGLAFDSTGNLYITDNQNNRIRRVDPAGVITTFAGNGSLARCGDGGPAVEACLILPGVVAINARDEIFFGDGGNAIRKIDTGGVITTAIVRSGGYCGDGRPVAEACFGSFSGFVFDAQDRLLIADGRNSRIRMVDADGIVSTVAGNGRPAFCGDGGPATAACLRGTNFAYTEEYLFDVAAGPDGSLFVNDGGNALIRKVDPVAVLVTREQASCRNAAGRLTFAAPAPVGGITAALHGVGAIAVPASVTVLPGRTSAVFPITIGAVAAPTAVQVSADFGTVVRRDVLVLTPVSISGIALDSPAAATGETVEGTVTLACAAAPGDVTVTLTSGKPDLAQPDMPSVTIPRGATTASFTVTVANPRRLTARVPIYATAGGVTRQAVLTVD